MHRLKGGKSAAKKKKNLREECSKSRKTTKKMVFGRKSQQRRKIEGLFKKLNDLDINHKFRGGLLGIKHFRVSTAKPTVSTARITYYWFKITVVGEKVNAAESLLVVSTVVNAN
ncbi:hypothetical protein Tco_1053798 [Tanacetum coccineum]|uniref:Transposase n=1 Tax=Tanacetum coccineum TaxID=301880 RepID=A0ABQ5GUZ2_9ASTR